MIPKTIHYCWFGGNPKPELAKKCISSWKKYCSDYEIIEWNESNFDIQSAPLFVQQAYEAKKWAFVTDYVRLKIVFDHGGIYFDTDVELINPPDRLLSEHAFFGFEDGIHIATGLGFGAEKNAYILVEMMDEYESLGFATQLEEKRLIPCPVYNTEVLLRHGLRQDDSEQLLEGMVRILPTAVLCPINYITGVKKVQKNTISIHWFAASWQSETTRKIQRKAQVLSRLVGNKMAWTLIGITKGIQNEGLIHYIVSRIRVKKEHD